MLSIALTAPRALAARVGDAPFGRALDTADELEREPCVLAIAVVFPLFAHRVASVARTAAHRLQSESSAPTGDGATQQTQTPTSASVACTFSHHSRT